MVVCGRFEYRKRNLRLAIAVFYRLFGTKRPNQPPTHFNISLARYYIGATRKSVIGLTPDP